MAIRRPLTVIGGIKTELPLGDTLLVPGACARTAATAGINTTATYVSPRTFSIPAVGLRGGEIFKIAVYGTCTSAAASEQTFVPRLGESGTTADASLGSITCTSGASGINVGFYLEMLIVVKAVGASGAVTMTGFLLNQGASGISNAAVVVNAMNTATPVNTSAGNLILGLSYSSASVLTTTIFRQVTVEQIV